ncbi:hypothetical protein Pcinc_004347 [Petrolisthes cinctipes]|uniref:Protein-L-isoaspartate O-methyltransferase domain-containing protein 1 n=1 Tax=Petrolisthes cinctipes TaxID=88211 RepID=A0AAE1GH83_PETCI|nr:hypothetical protein Pcinc_004347 [Petrolisthes cinctipes]
MGGAVSAGVDNDDLVDNLKAASYISTPLLERVFRAVDRGDYFTTENREQAYRDSAWKKGNLHLSAPCIYAKVMEGLQLAPGHSFLNLGSGTGYLSTMAGLIIGPYGVNHGVELHADVLQYATIRLNHFKSTSPAVDAFPFCEPNFVQGNCLCLPPDMRLYDRVYCGASCPESHEQYMKALIKPGGVLVMPLNDQLVQMTRNGPDSWERTPLLPVSFSSLVMPDPNHPPPIVNLPNVELMDLQDLCRQKVRGILREAVEQEHPDLTTAANRPVQPRPKPRGDRRHFRRIVVPYVPGPFYESEDEDEDEEEEGGGEVGDGLVERGGVNRPNVFYYPRSRTANRISAFIEFARNLAGQQRQEDEDDDDDDDADDDDDDDELGEEENEDDEDEVGEGKTRRTRRDNHKDEVVVEGEGDNDDVKGEGEGTKGCRRSHEEDGKEEGHKQGKLNNEKKEEEQAVLPSSSNKKMKEEKENTDSNKEEKMEEGEVEEVEMENVANNPTPVLCSTIPSSSSMVPHSDPIPTPSSSCPAKPQTNKNNNKKREKFDSGVGDEIENGKGPSSEDSEEGDEPRMEVDSSSETESDSDYSDNSAPRTKVTRYLDEDDPNCPCGSNCGEAFRARRRAGTKEETNGAKKEGEEDRDEGEKGGEGGGEEETGGAGRDSTSSIEILSAVETHMREKINLLPLPQALKLYLNYNREL